MSDYFLFASALPPADFEQYSDAISCEDFLTMASDFLSPADVQKLSRVSIDAACEEGKSFEAELQAFVVPEEPVEVFRMWDTQLRNDIAMRRGGSRSGFMPRYVAAVDAFSAQGVARSYEAADPWEKARAIDRMRWNKLEELSATHYGDREYIFLYYLKIQLLAKWTVRTAERGKENFEKAVEGIYAACDSDLKKE